MSLTESEFLVLRQTIAARGTVRMALLPMAMLGWAVTATLLLLFSELPVAALFSLGILVGGFEAIHALHAGVERIGRYLQVFHEDAGERDRPLRDTPSWERVAMSFGNIPGVGGHPLFVPVFFLATMCNYIAVIIPGPLPIEIGVMAVPHVALIAWLLIAARAVKSQREIELARMRDLASR